MAQWVPSLRKFSQQPHLRWSSQESSGKMGRSKDFLWSSWKERDWAVSHLLGFGWGQNLRSTFSEDSWGRLTPFPTATTLGAVGMNDKSAKSNTWPNVKLPVTNGHPFDSWLKYASIWEWDGMGQHFSPQMDHRLECLHLIFWAPHWLDFYLTYTLFWRFLDMGLPEIIHFLCFFLWRFMDFLS